MSNSGSRNPAVRFLDLTLQQLWIGDVLESLVSVHDALPAALAAKLSGDWMDQRWLHGRHQALQGRSWERQKDELIKPIAVRKTVSLLNLHATVSPYMIENTPEIVYRVTGYRVKSLIG